MAAVNALYYGDNLDILRHHIGTATVDLVYLDPPFNSKRDYNVLFKEKSGEASPAQIEAFTDTWAWDRATERAYDELITDAPANVVQMIAALRQFIGSNDMMAYLVMMAARLVELHRVLKPTGSLCLHCDSTASHYLKIVLDTIFGKDRFRNEINWKRSHAHNDSRQGSQHFGRITDAILFYTKGEKYIWNQQYTPYDPDYIERDYRRVDENGRRYRVSDLSGPGGAAKGNPYYEVMGVSRHWRFSKEKMEELIRQGRIIQTRTGAVPQYIRYLDEMPGVPVQDIWDDLPILNNRSKEFLGYPTQKPLALLERIIAASSNPGDVVLDPFCGCGTAVVAAEKLGRRWVGIDITHLSIALMRYRLTDAFPNAVFEVRGEPADVGSATALAEADRYQFQWWALSLVKAKPIEGKEKKGADRGIDGVINFVDDHTGKLKRCLVQVKSGHVQRNNIGDLISAVTREAEMGIFVTLEPSTGPMRKDATEAGWYHSEGWNRDYPKIQILTIEELLTGKLPDMPPMRQTFQRSERIAVPGQRQEALTGFGEG